MIEKAKTLLLSLTPIALMYIIQIAAALGGQILIIWANQFMAMAHVYHHRFFSMQWISMCIL